MSVAREHGQGAFKSALAYYAAALWPIIPGLASVLEIRDASDTSCALDRYCDPAVAALDDGVDIASSRIAYGERLSRYWQQSFRLSELSGLLRQSPEQAIFFRARAGPGW